MTRLRTATFLLMIAVPAALAQPPRRLPGGVPSPPDGAAGEEAARGIEKKDIRALIVYPEGIYSPADVQRVEAGVRRVVDAIAAGAKLTKADAARAGAGGSGAETAAAQIARSMAPNRRVVFAAADLWPASAGQRPVACPPENCGCGFAGAVKACDCTLLNGEFCMCLLCQDYRPLPTIPQEDPVLGSITIKGRTATPPGEGRPDGVLVLLVAPPNASAQLRQKLAATAAETLKAESWPARLTIKTKSSPP